MKKLSNTEAELKKRVAYKIKKECSLITVVRKHFTFRLSISGYYWI